MRAVPILQESPYRACWINQWWRRISKSSRREGAVYKKKIGNLRKIWTFKCEAKKRHYFHYFWKILQFFQVLHAFMVFLAKTITKKNSQKILPALTASDKYLLPFSFKINLVERFNWSFTEYRILIWFSPTCFALFYLKLE